MKGEQAFTNIDRMIDEVRQWIRRDKLESYVLNSGNLSDSLAFEKVRPVMARLIEVFRKEAQGRPHTLLIVTKGGMDECRPFLNTRGCENIIISFSINNSEAARRHESGVPPVKERLQAATALKKLGWRVRIRLDPMIIGYDYSDVLRKLRKLAPERITLGTLRAENNLPRFVDKGLFRELEPPSDKKGLARYPLAKRLALYHQAVAALKDICPLGLCEEEELVWNDLGLDTQTGRCNCCA